MMSSFRDAVQNIILWVGVESHGHVVDRNRTRDGDLTVRCDNCGKSFLTLCNSAITDVRMGRRITRCHMECNKEVKVKELTLEEQATNAATMRHNDGNLRKSIEHNANRFGLSPQLVRIMENTVELVEG